MSFFSGDTLGKTLITIGVILILIGIVLYFGSKLLPFGRLPGDIHIEKENFTFHFPIVTSLIISILLTILLNLLKP